MNAQSLLTRLDEIGGSLARSGHALALIGLGSIGQELDRLDGYSDLDFFVIVEEGWKASYITSLEWLSNIHPIAYRFLNTDDGYKLLFEDGIFCEFAVFELGELNNIPFAPGRVIWKRMDVPDSIGDPVLKTAPHQKPSRDFLLGEAITNLYIGLQRDKRGEKLSAMRFIQGYALDRLLELAEYIEPGNDIHRDPFVNERRFEQRFPGVAKHLPLCLQGYDKNRESALAILEFLEANFDVDQKMANEIHHLYV